MSICRSHMDKLCNKADRREMGEHFCKICREGTCRKLIKIFKNKIFKLKLKTFGNFPLVIFLLLRPHRTLDLACWFFGLICWKWMSWALIISTLTNKKHVLLAPFLSNNWFVDVGKYFSYYSYNLTLEGKTRALSLLGTFYLLYSTTDRISKNSLLAIIFLSL